MLGKLGSILCVLALPLAGVHAQDEPERLPGRGELKADVPTAAGLGRLIPGGGLLLSFDSDQDGFITKPEIEEGIAAAFLKADENEDDRITPLEQIKWSDSLPTRDVSLANPARFDPNLDRSVRRDEFTNIIMDFAAIHTDELTGLIPVTALKYKGKGRPSPQFDGEETEANGRRGRNRDDTEA